MTDPAQSLLDALQEWARKTLPAPPSGHVAPECQWCPLCQLAGVLRGEHPELTERVAEAGAAVTTAVRALLDSAATRTPGRPSPGAKPGTPSDPTPAKPHPRPRVERIVLDDEIPKG